MEKQRKVTCKKAGLGEGAEKSLKGRRQHEGGGGWLSNQALPLVNA